MAVEIISWSISAKEWDQAVIKLAPLDLQSDTLLTALHGLAFLILSEFGDF